MDVISPELPQFLRLIIALGVVFALMGGLAFALKKLGLATPQSIKSSNKRRLSVVESLPLDARRRLMIVKCDSKEHLVILGTNNDIIIDADIPPVDDSVSTGQSS